MQKISFTFCVFALLIYQSAIANDRFIFSANGTEVTDTSTGLIWLRCSAGQQFSSDRCIGKATEHNFKGAQAYAKSRATRLNAWRVPTVDELGTLVVPAGRPAAIDNTAFPDTVSNRYWSSTPHDTDATQAMIVLFKDGHIFKYHRNNKAHLRLVRN